MPGEWFQLAVEDTASGALVGDLATHVDADEHRQLEVGFTLAPEHQGKGYGTEALRGLLAYAFDTLEMHRVIAVTDAENAAAAALLDPGRASARRRTSSTTSSSRAPGAASSCSRCWPRSGTS